MSGETLAYEIIKKFDTKDVLILCQKNAIKLLYESWNPSTIGEFDSKNRTITVNLKADIDFEQIITHELGHYFIHQKGIKLTRIEEEKVVETFVKIFLNFPLQTTNTTEKHSPSPEHTPQAS